jgi:type II secretory pathway pseudopilin PulG
MNYKKSQLNYGFTVVELVVVLGIFVVISGIILFNYQSFRTNTTVNTVSQEIALTVRKAQSYALGLQASGVLANLPIKGYGVRFESIRPDQITFFTEISPIDNQFTSVYNSCGLPVSTEECIEYYKIETGDKIEELIVDGEVLKLTDPLSSVDVIFKKPSGDVIFCVHKFGSSCNSSSSTPVSVFDVVLVSKGGVRKYVHIYGNGQISTD